MRLLRPVTGFTVASLLALSAVASGGSAAIASCNPGRTDNDNYYWVYRVDAREPHIVNGVRSDIYVYHPYVHPGGFSYGWVMLTAAGNYHWAQIGNYSYSGGRHASLQWANGTAGSVHQVDFAGKTLGATPTFTVIYDTPNQAKTFHFKINGVEKYFVDVINWTPTAAEISSEITTLASQMMGDTSEHVTYSNNHIKTDMFDTWIDFAGSLGYYNSTYFGQSGSATSFATWDKGCQS